MILFPTALLILLSAAAGTGIITANLFRLNNSGRGLLLLVELLASLLGKQGIPFRQLVKPLRLCAYHIVIQLFHVHGQVDGGFLGQALQVILNWTSGNTFNVF